MFCFSKMHQLNAKKLIFTEDLKILSTAHLKHSSFFPSANVKPLPNALKCSGSACLLSLCVHNDLSVQEVSILIFMINVKFTDHLSWVKLEFLY
jgi:hypothetical protein